MHDTETVRLDALPNGYRLLHRKHCWASLHPREPWLGIVRYPTSQDRVRARAVREVSPGHPQGRDPVMRVVEVLDLQRRKVLLWAPSSSPCGSFWWNEVGLTTLDLYDAVSSAAWSLPGGELLAHYESPDEDPYPVAPRWPDEHPLPGVSYQRRSFAVHPERLACAWFHAPDEQTARQRPPRIQLYEPDASRTLCTTTLAPPLPWWEVRHLWLDWVGPRCLHAVVDWHTQYAGEASSSHQRMLYALRTDEDPVGVSALHLVDEHTALREGYSLTLQGAQPRLRLDDEGRLLLFDRRAPALAVVDSRTLTLRGHHALPVGTAELQGELFVDQRTTTTLGVQRWDARAGRLRRLAPLTVPAGLEVHPAKSTSGHGVLAVALGADTEELRNSGEREGLLLCPLPAA